MNKPTRKQVFVIVFLTLFISAGAFAYQLATSNIDERADYISNKISNKLDLQKHQEQKLDALKKQLLALINQVRQNKQQSKEQVLALMSGEQLDRDGASRLLKEKINQMNQDGSPLITAFADFYDSLDAKQQQLIKDRMRSHHSHFHN